MIIARESAGIEMFQHILRRIGKAFHAESSKSLRIRGLVTQDLRATFYVDVFVMAFFRFGRRREGWLRQLRREMQTGR